MCCFGSEVSHTAKYTDASKVYLHLHLRLVLSPSVCVSCGLAVQSNQTQWASVYTEQLPGSGETMALHSATSNHKRPYLDCNEVIGYVAGCMQFKGCFMCNVGKAASLLRVAETGTIEFMLVVSVLSN